MVDAWISQILNEPSYAECLVSWPGDARHIILNGNYVLSCAIEDLQAAEKEIDTESVSDYIGILTPAGFDTTFIYTRSVSEFARFNSHQSSIDPAKMRLSEIYDFLSAGLEVVWRGSDFITELHNTLRAIIAEEGNIIIYDKNDMTLLALLYLQNTSRMHLYITSDHNYRELISVSNIINLMKTRLGDHSMTMMNNLLFVLPLFVLTGIPNLVAYQVSITPIHFGMLATILSDIGGLVYAHEHDILCRIPLIRLFCLLAEREMEHTHSLIPRLHEVDCSTPFDPEIVEIEEYVNEYHTADDLIHDDREIVYLSVYYLSAMTQLACYLSGKEFVYSYSFKEAPLCYDICHTLSKLQDKEYIAPQKDPYIRKLESDRTFNRYPILHPFE